MRYDVLVEVGSLTAAGAYGGYFEGLAGFSDRPWILGRGDVHENLSVITRGRPVRPDPGGESLL